MVDELNKKKNAGFGELIQSKTSFTISTDFSEIVDDVLENDNLVYSDFLPKVTTVGVSETIETSLGSDNHFSANFTTICQSGNVGAGNVVVSWRRPFGFGFGFGFRNWSGLSTDNSFGFGSRKFISSALINQIDKYTNGSIQLAVGLRGGAIYPQLNTSISRIINPSLVASLQLVQAFNLDSLMNSFSFSSSSSSANNSTINTGHLSLTLSNKTSPEINSPYTISVTIPTSGDLRTGASLEAKKTFFIDSKHEIRIKFGGSEQHGSSLDFGIHRKFNIKTRASATLQLDQNIGVNLRLGFSHDCLHLILPLRFSHEFSPIAMIVASLIPTVSDYISRNVIYPHLLKKRKEQYWNEYREKRAALMERKREEAEIACELMKQNLEKKGLCSDLKIIEASYRSIERPEMSWSVKIPLQFLLNTEGKIKLDPAYRANVLGFFDIAPGENKETWILYEFRGILHEVVIRDNEELLLPQRSHVKQ